MTIKSIIRSRVKSVAHVCVSFIFICFFFSICRAELSSTYTFTSGAGSDKWAYYTITEAAKPPATGPAIIGETEFNSTEYTAIDSSDDVKATHTSTAQSQAPVHNFKFTINESMNDITQIYVEWQGYNLVTNSPDATLYIWDSASWVPLVSTLEQVDVILSSTIVSNCYKYINSGYLHLAAEGKVRTGKDTGIVTDFVKVIITTAAPGADVTSPSPITTLTALLPGATGQITLMWSAPGDDALTGDISDGKFRIDYATWTKTWAYSDYKIELDTTCSPLSWHNRVVTGLNANATYYFRIWTRDENTDNWSGLSNGATQSTLAMPPQNPALYVANASSVTISWDAGGNPLYTKYDIEHSSVSGSTGWQLIGSKTLQTISYDTGLTENATYWYRIRAFNNNSIPTEYSFVASTMTLNLVPSSITNLSALMGNIEGSIRLSWTAPGDDGVSGALQNGEFRIQYSTSPDANEKGGWSSANYNVAIPTACLALSMQSHRITSLIKGAAYYFRIWTRDENVSNWSGLSNGATSQPQLWLQSVICKDADTLFQQSTAFSNSRDMARDSAGNLYMVYHKYVSTKYEIWFALSADDGENWSSNGGYRIHPVYAQSQKFPSLAIDNSNNIHCTWTGQDNAGDYHIYYSRYNGTTWSAPVYLSTTTATTNCSPGLDADYLGDVYVFWQDDVTQRIYFRKCLGGVWQDTEIIHEEPTGKVDFPCVDIDKEHKIHVVFEGKTAGNDYHIYSRTYDGAWSPVTYISTSAYAQKNPCLVLDSNEGLHVTWSEQTGVGAYQISYASSTDGQNWKQAVIESASNDVKIPDVFMDDKDVLHLFWMAKDGSSVYQLKRSSKTLSDTDWSAPQWFTNSDQNQQYPTSRWANFHLHGGGMNWAWMDGNDVRFCRDYNVAVSTGKTADIIAPAVAEDLNAETNIGTDGSIRLTWLSPGDDNNVGQLGTESDPAKYRIQYSSDSNPSGGWDKDNYDIEIATWDVSANNFQSAVVNGLNIETTWFFRLWTRDECVTGWSGISNSTSCLAYIKPSAVTTLAALAPGTTGQARLTWLAPGDDAWSGTIVNGKFTVDYNEYSIELDTSCEPASRQYYTVSGLQTNSTYYFSVWTRDENPLNWSGLSNGATQSTLCNIPLISGFTGIYTSSLTVNWQANDNPAGTMYYAECSSVSAEGAVFSSSWTVLQSWQPFDLSPNATYYFRVKARNNNSIDTNYADLMSTHTRCAAPGAVTFDGVNISSVSVSWDSNGNPNYTVYELQSSTAADTQYNTIYAGSVLSYIHEGLAANVTYYYRARARNLDGLYSDFALQAATHTQCNTPGQISLDAAAETSINLSWLKNNNSESTVYTLEASSETNTNYNAVYSGTDNNYTHSPLTPNATYYYRVFAVNLDDIKTEYNSPASTHTLCSMPSNPGFTSVNEAEIGIGWETGGNSGSTVYEIEASTGTDLGYGVIYAGYGLSHTHSGLLPNVTYYYKVRAKNLGNAYSAYASALSTHTKCNQPGALSFVSAGETQINLSWDTNGNSESTIYKLESSSGTDTNYMQIYQGADNTYTHTPLIPNATYYYKVYAANLDEIDTGYNTANSTHTLCNAPSGLGFGVVTEDSVSVQWQSNGNSGSTIYEVAVSTGAAANYGLLYSGYGLDFTHSGLMPNVTYYYQARAKNLDEVFSGYSAPADTHTLCNAPSSLVFTGISIGAVSIEWQDSGNSDSTVYEVEESADNSDWALRVSTRGLTFIDADLAPNGTHYYRARARNLDNVYSDFSNLITTSTLAAPPADAGHSGNTETSISWAWQSGGGQKDYYAWTVTPSSSSGWITGASWSLSDLAPNTSYQLFVKARNWNDIETVELSTSVFTSIEQPTGIVFNTINAVSIEAAPAGILSGLGKANSGVLIHNVSTDTYSGWQGAADYWLSLNLSTNAAYAFEAKARNGDGDETVYCGAVSTFSRIEQAPGIDFGTITENSIQARPAGAFSNLAPLNSGIYTKNVTKGTGAGWVKDASYWNSTGLLPNMTYYFEVNSRNQAAAENTAAGAYRSTLCSIPVAPAITAVSSSTINVKINTSGNPYWTVYSVKFLTGGTTYYAQEDKTLNSGKVYLTTSSWSVIDVTGLDENTLYDVSVSAKNNDGTATNYGAAAGKYTLLDPPSDAELQVSTVSTAQLNLLAAQPPNAGAGLTGCEFDNITGAANGGTDSGILTGIYTYDDFELSTNTQYGYKARYYNGDGQPTSWNTTEKHKYTPAALPSMLSAVANGEAPNSGLGHVNLSWSKNGNPSGTIYEAYCITTSSYFWTGASTECAHPELVDMTTYQYVARAKNNDGMFTGWVSTVSAYTPDRTPPVDTLSPVVSWLDQGQNSGGNQVVKVEKELTSGAAMVEFFCSQGVPRHNFEKSVSSYQYTAADVGDSQNYAYVCRMWDGDGNYSLWSDTESIAIGDRTPPGPDPAVVDSAVAVSTSVITWDGADGADVTGVEYLFSCSNGIDSGWINYSSFTFNGLNANTSYYATIKLRDTIMPPNTGAVSAPLWKYSLANTPFGLNAAGYGNAPNSGTGYVEVFWDNNNNPEWTGYELRCDSGTGYFTCYSGTDTSFTHLSLNDRTSYWYEVRAENGDSEYTPYTSSAPAYTPDRTAPQAPGAPYLVWIDSGPNTQNNQYVKVGTTTASADSYKYEFILYSPAQSATYYYTGTAGEGDHVFYPINDEQTVKGYVYAYDADGNYGLWSVGVSTDIGDRTPPPPSAPAAPGVEWIDQGPNSGNYQVVKVTSTLPGDADRLNFHLTITTPTAQTLHSGLTTSTTWGFEGIWDEQTVSGWVTAYDPANNWADSDNRNAGVGDRTEPSVPAQPVLSWLDQGLNSEDTQKVELQGVIPPNANRLRYKLIANGGTTIYYGPTAETAHTYININDTQTVDGSLQAWDADNNFSSWSVFVSTAVKDRTAPANPSAPAVEWIDSGYNSGDTQRVKAQKTLTSGAAKVEFFCSSGTPQHNSGISVSTYFVTANDILDEQNYGYVCRMYDDEGNYSLWSATQAAVIEDRTPPVAPDAPETVWIDKGVNSSAAQWVIVKGTIPAGANRLEYKLLHGSTTSQYLGGVGKSSHTFINIGDSQTVNGFIRAYDTKDNYSDWAVNASTYIADRTAPPLPTLSLVNWLDQGLNSADTQKISVGGSLPPGADRLYYKLLADGVTYYYGPAAETAHTFENIGDSQTASALLTAYDLSDNFSAWTAPVSDLVRDRTAPQDPVAPAVAWLDSGNDSRDTQQVSVAQDFTLGAATVTFDCAQGLPEYDFIKVTSTEQVTAGDVQDSQTYIYRSRMYDEEGNYSNWSGEAGVAVPDRTAPGEADTFLGFANPAGMRIDLLWTNPSAPDFRGAMVRFSTSSYPSGYADGEELFNKTTDQGLVPGLTTDYYHLGLENQVTYYYMVFTYDAYPNYSTGISTVVCTMDQTPPVPDPAALSYALSVSTEAITWYAITGYDPAGVQYRFNGDAGDSGWITASTFTFSGLSANTSYYESVQLSDNYGNSGTASPAQWKYTLIQQAAGVEFGAIAQDSIEAKPAGDFSNMSYGGTGVIVYETSTSTDSGWKQDLDYWQLTNLEPNVTYTFKANSRNSESAANAATGDYTKSTLSRIPSAPALTAVSSGSINVVINANGNPLHTPYAIKFVAAGATYYVQADDTLSAAPEVYKTGASWNAPNVHGLDANTEYIVSVRAKNNEDITTDYGPSSVRYTLGREPSIICDKSAGVWYNVPQSSFTSTENFGEGGAQYYRYAWDQNPSHTWTDTETQWSSGDLVLNSDSDGQWYLHLRSYNAESIGTAAAKDFGPYSYDASTPAVTVDYPLSGSWYAVAVTSYNGSISETGGSGINIGTLEYSRGGSAWTAFGDDAGMHDWDDINEIPLTGETTGIMLQVRVKDNAGNTGTSSIYTVKADTSAPAGTKAITFSEVWMTSMTVAGAVLKDMTEGNTYYQFDCVNDDGYDRGWMLSDNVSENAGMQPNRQYTFRYQAKDGLNNTTQWSSSVSTYTLPAVPDVTCGRVINTWYNDSTFTFSTAAGTGFGAGGVQYYRYAWDQNPSYTWTDSEPQWFTGNAYLGATGNGSWYLHLKSYNNANRPNPVTKNYGPYNYDEDSPAITLDYPISGSWYTVAVTSYNGSISETGGSGINFGTLEYSKGGSAWTAFGDDAGIHDWDDINEIPLTGETTGITLQVRVKDNAGNTGTSSIYTVKADTSAPEGSKAITFSEVWMTSMTVAGAVLKDMTEGSTYYQFDCVNDDGYDRGWVLSDNISENAGMQPNRQYTFKYQAKDGLDNTGEWSDEYQKCTLAAKPDVSCIGRSTDSWYNNNAFTFNNSAGFGAGGVQYYRYVWDKSQSHAWTETEATWNSGTLARTAATEGQWYLHLKSYNAESIGTAAAKDFGPYSYDASTPAVTVDYPVSGSWYTVAVTSYNGSISETGGAGINLGTLEYSKGGSAWTAFGDDAGIHDWDDINEIPLTGETTGITLQVRVKDNAGNTGTSSIYTVKADTSAPEGSKAITFSEVWMTSMNVAGAVLKDMTEGSTYYQFDCTNDDGYDRGWVLSDNVSENAGMQPNRQYTFKYQAKDGLNNTTQWSASVSTYTLAEIPANLNAAAYGGTLNSGKGYIELNWNGGDNPAGTTYELYCITTDSKVYSGTELGFTKTDLDDETTYWYAVRAANNLGLFTVYTSSVSAYIPDRTAPAVPSAPDAPGIVWNDLGVNSGGTQIVEVRCATTVPVGVDQWKVDYSSGTGTGLTGWLNISTSYWLNLNIADGQIAGYGIRWRDYDETGNWSDSALSSTGSAVIGDRTPPSTPEIPFVNWSDSGLNSGDTQTVDICNGNGEAKYRYILASGIGCSDSPDYTTANTTFTNINLPDSQLVAYFVRSYDGSDNYSDSQASSATVKDRTAPDLPAHGLPLSGSQANDLTPLFDWTDAVDNGDSGISHYEIQVDTTPDIAAPLTYTANPSTSVSTPGAELETGWYWWRIRAFDNENNYTSWTATWSAQVVEADPPTPNPAQMNYAEAVSSTAIRCYAVPGTDISGLFYKFEGNAETSGWITESTHTFNGLTPNTTYSITSRMKDGFNNIGDSSTPVYKCTLAAVPAALSAAGYGGAPNSGTGYADLSWGPNNNSIGTIYEIFEIQSGLTVYTGTSTVFTHANLDDAATYYYKIRAQNHGGGYTLYTSSAPAYIPDRTPPSNPPGPPQVAWNDAGLNSADFQSVTVSTTLAADAAMIEFYCSSGAPAYNFGASAVTLHTTPGDLNDSQDYNYVYRYWDDNGNYSNWSPTGTVYIADRTAPQNPQNPLCTAGDTKITVSWTADPSADRYDIYRDSGSGYQFLAFETYPAATHLDQNLVNDVTYYYRLKAADSTGNESGYSVVVSTYARLLIPYIATNVTGAALSESSIEWSWTDNAFNELGFRVVSSTGGVLYDSFAPNTTYWAMNNLAANTSYTCFVRAYNDNGESSSAPDSCYTMANLPGSLYYVSKDTVSAILAWNGNGATRFAIERAFNEPPGSWSYIIQWNDSLVTPVYKDENLLPDSTYWYRVRGYNAESVVTAPGNQIAVKTDDHTAPAAVTDLLTAPGSAEGIVDLKWTAPGDNGKNGLLYSGRYEIRWSTGSSDGWSSPYAVSWPTSTVAPGQLQTMSIAGLIKGKTYYFWMKTADEIHNWSAVSNTAAAIAQYDFIKPADVTDLAASAASAEGIARLAWTAPGDDGKSGNIMNGMYLVKYTKNPNHTWSQAPYQVLWTTSTGPGSAENRDFSGLTPGETYYFWVTVSDEDSNWSGISNRADGWAQVDITPPAAAQLSVSKVSDKAVHLRWAAPGDDGAGGTAYGYDLRYSTWGIIDTGAKFNSASAVEKIQKPKHAGNPESFMLAGLAEKTTYYFALMTVDESQNWSGLSNSPSAVTSPKKRIAPSEPHGVRGAVHNNRKGINLKWSPPDKYEDGSPCDNLKGYNIYRCNVINGAYALRGFVPGGTLEWDEPEDISGAVYYFTIRAVDADDNESKTSVIVDNSEQQNIIVLAEDGQTSVVIPKEASGPLYKDSNSYNEDVNVVIKRNEEEETGKTICYYEIKALDPKNDEEIRNFSINQQKAKISINLSYSEKLFSGSFSRLSMPKSLSGADAVKWLGVMWFNGVEWVKLDGKVDENTQTIKVLTSHLGKYRIQYILRATEFELVQVWPRKVFTPNGDGINDEINFMYENPKESVVTGTVYDVTGAFVSNLSPGGDASSLKWDGRNSDGGMAREGVYIYQIKAEGKTLNGTVVIVR